MTYYRKVATKGRLCVEFVICCYQLKLTRQIFAHICQQRGSHFDRINKVQIYLLFYRINKVQIYLLFYSAFCPQWDGKMNASSRLCVPYSNSSKGREADTIPTDSVPTDAIPTICIQDDPVHL